jgi:hypothetical protein
MQAIEESKMTGERINKSIQVTALDSKQEIVATFEMIVSVKVK